MPSPDRPIKCPTCGRVGAWVETTYGPFCSKRCKLVDLGKWLGEEHHISSPLKAEHLEDYEDLPSGRHLDEPEKGEP